MKLRVTVQGNVYDVDVEVVQDSAAGASSAPVAPVAAVAAPPRPAPVAAAPAPSAPVSSGAKVFPAPLAGTIRAVKVKPGDDVKPNDELLVLEAMKMETSVSSDRSGRIKAVHVNVGDAVQSGKPLVEFE
ncbi:acetyl-CoA carboxylase biotin carboxyl carrier protein subunit [bacterium]|nr:acetyl-CoA carboxylase biotin carboxyl carrier protein subunit [bacterium]